jgi:hypothetical protein
MNLKVKTKIEQLRAKKIESEQKLKLIMLNEQTKIERTKNLRILNLKLRLGFETVVCKNGEGKRGTVALRWWPDLKVRVRRWSDLR